MSPIKKMKMRGKPAGEMPLAPKGAYEGGDGLYDGGHGDRSLDDEMRASYRYASDEREAKLHGTSKSKHRRLDVEERQVIPLLFLFKWAVLGGLGLGLVLVLRVFLGAYNKNASEEITELRAQVAAMSRSRVERPVLDLGDSDQIPVLVQHWQDARENIVAAQELMRWDRRAEAERRLHDALMVVPESQEARLLTAQIAMKNKEYERAANLLVQSLNTDPGRYDLALMLATSLESLREDKSALFVAEWALSNRAGDLEPLGIASRAAVRLENWASALVHFDKILIVDENNVAALKGASTIYFNEGNYAKSLPLFLRLMDKEPANWRYFFNAAVCQAQLGQLNNTVKTLELAASRFGDARVYSWTGAAQFDPVRGEDLFVGFHNRVAQISQRKEQKKIEREAPKFAPAAPALPSGNLLKVSK